MSKHIIFHGRSLSIGIIIRVYDSRSQISLLSFEVVIFVSSVVSNLFLHIQIYTTYSGNGGKCNLAGELC